MDLAILFLFLPLLISGTNTAIDPSCSPPKIGTSDIPIIQLHGPCSPFSPSKADSWPDTVIKMASKDLERVAYLSSLVARKGEAKATSAPVASGQQVLNVGNYLVQVKIGTPGQDMFMVLDTSNDAAWVPCSGCTGCPSTTSFTPKLSVSYGQLECSTAQCTQVRGLACPTVGSSPCLFNQSYGGDSSFFATLSQDSLSLGTDVIPNYVFGCINSMSGTNMPPQGLLGLGRGSMSLLSQSGSVYDNVFSYCLPSFKSYFFSGSLRLGPKGQPRRARTTPLLKNPHRPSLYYVNLTGISVGKVKVSLPRGSLAFDPITGAGTVIDSGTVITRFVKPVYNAIRDEFKKQLTGPFSSLGAFDTCFLSSVMNPAPTVTLHFLGLDLRLPTENTLIHSSSGSLACLAMAAAPNNVNSVLNVIANLQQQNLRIMFDVANSRVAIVREVCN